MEAKAAEPLPDPRVARRLLDACGVATDGLSESAVRARATTIVLAVRAFETESDPQDHSLVSMWDRHVEAEFAEHSLERTMATMAPHPYVNHVPTSTGGFGWEEVKEFYRNHFLPKLPKDARIRRISRTVGFEQVVDELVLSFTHDTTIDFMLPGVAPTGARVELPHVVVVGFEQGKVHHEHIWWDQASLLVQVGLLDPNTLPVLGVQAARKLRNPSLPSNELLARFPPK